MRQEDARQRFGGGLFVSEGGIVLGHGKRFGILDPWGSEFVSEDGTHFTDVESAFLSDGGTMFVCRSDGTTDTVSGVPMKDSDKLILPNSGRNPKYISELEVVFPYIYPDAEDQIYTDELDEKPYSDMAMIGKEGGFEPLSGATLGEYHADMERRLTSLGLTGAFPPYKVRDEMLDMLAHRHKRNFFREWVESHEWDGIARVRTWFQDTFGATAKVLKDPADESRYLGDVAEAWFIGGVRRMYEETKHEIVPVLVGSQGIMKGTAIQYTAGMDQWYVECTEDVNNTPKFLDAVRGRVIVELSEGTQLRGPDVEALKAFISKSEDQFRKPYARYEETHPRHFIMIASTNLDNIFTDITGNRRFFPMYCDPDKASREFSVDRTVGQYDVEQVWAEALAMYRDGHRWYPSPELASLASRMQEFYTQENSNVSVIEDWLDDPMNHCTAVGTKVSKAMIMEHVFGVMPDTLPSKEQETAYRAWTNATKTWRKVAAPVRINGRSSRAYERVKSPDAPDEDPKRLKVVDGASDGRDPVEMMRAQAESDGLRPGSPFRPLGMTPAMLDRLLDLGWVSYSTLGDGHKMWIYLGDPDEDPDMDK